MRGNAEVRNSAEIRVWMIRNGHTINSIRTDLQYRTHTPVSLTISGARNLRKVLRYLLEQGCPARYLALPGDMRKSA